MVLYSRRAARAAAAQNCGVVEVIPTIEIDITGLAELPVALVAAAAVLGACLILGFLIVAQALNGATHFERWKFEVEREEQRQALERIRARQAATGATVVPAQFSLQEPVLCPLDVQP